jgi:hypothetical protein
MTRGARQPHGVPVPNQRFAGLIRHGTNLTPLESAQLDAHIANALFANCSCDGVNVCSACARQIAEQRAFDRLTRCWCGAQIMNGHHCDNGHMQPRAVEFLA